MGNSVQVQFSCRKKARMDQVQELLESGERIVDWKVLLETFASLKETERTRFSWVSPREGDLKWLREYLVKEKVDRLIGVGCGSGFLERVVAEFSGLPVTGIEFKNGWWMSKFCPKKFIPTEFASTPLDENLFDQDCYAGQRQALFFCYFNDARAFNEYLSVFRGHHLILVGPKDNVGVHADPMPLCPEIKQPGWTFQDCRHLEDDVNVICVYKRIE